MSSRYFTGAGPFALTIGLVSCSRNPTRIDADAAVPSATALPAPTPTLAKRHPPPLVTRVTHVPKADGCDGAATSVFVGFDANANGTLDDGEEAPRPMTFCSTSEYRTTIVSAPPSFYCPWPGAVVKIEREGPDAGTTPSELVVCLDERGDRIAATIPVYLPR